jgi:F-type H+-transporting ATPase subunit b
MTLDPLTLLAQLLNFAVLLVLLRVFLYKPVLETMRKREELASAALAEARRLREEAEVERRALAAERAAEERERALRMAALDAEVERLRTERLGAVEREAQQARAARLEALAQEVERVSSRLGPELARLVLDEVGETVGWLTGAEADDLALARFVERLRGLPAERREELRAAALGGAVRLVTARPPSAAAAEEARRAVTEVLGAVQLELAVDPELVLGAVLQAGGLSVDGSAAARLTALEERFAAALTSTVGERREGAA